MYTKKQFGTDIKKLLQTKKDTSEIGSNIFSLYYSNINDCEEGIDDIAELLSLMECGDEFSYSIQELNKIADCLILGQGINLENK